jgi:hypothetical protein
MGPFGAGAPAASSFNAEAAAPASFAFRFEATGAALSPSVVASDLEVCPICCDGFNDLADANRHIYPNRPACTTRLLAPIAC